MKTLTFISMLFLGACGDVPAGPSPDLSHDYHPLVITPGTCISGTSASCLTVIPTPAPPPPPAPPAPALVDLSVLCTPVAPDNLTVNCEVNHVRNEQGRQWTSHVMTLDFDWGDGSADRSYGLSAQHTYKSHRTWSWGVVAIDDRSVQAYTSGGVSTIQKQ